MILNKECWDGIFIEHLILHSIYIKIKEETGNGRSCKHDAIKKKKSVSQAELCLCRENEARKQNDDLKNWQLASGFAAVSIVVVCVAKFERKK